MSVEPVRDKQGNLRRDDDGAIVHRVRWREGGRERSRIVGKRADAEAFDAHMRLQRRIGGSGLTLSADQRFAALASDWWDLYARPNLGQRTLEQYGFLLDRYLLPRLGGLRLRELTPESIAAFRVDLERAKVGRWSVARSLTLLHGILARAVAWGRIAHNPAAGVPRPSTKRQRPVEIVPPELVEQMRALLLERGRRRDAALVCVLAYTGLRPFEALALTQGQVSARTLAVEVGKLERPRSVDIFKPLAQDLAAWRLACGRPAPSALLFPDHKGERWSKDGWDNWRQRVYQPLARELGLGQRHRPYDLRHSFVSLLIAEGRSVAEVAEQAGHSPAVCLGTYLHAFRSFDPAQRMSPEERITQARREAEEERHRHAT